jgi:hypothetical protein
MSAKRIISKSVAADLLGRELSLLDPEVRRDRERVSEALARDFFEFGASGRVWRREEILDLLATGEFNPPVVEDFACHAIAPDVVLVTYRAIRADAETGRHETTLCSSLWSRETGTWLMRFHQGTRLH